MFRRHTDVTAVSPEAVEHVTSICHIWKLQTFDLFYLELKLRFPITAEMLTDIRNLIRKRFVDAEQPFDIELLRVSTMTSLRYIFIQYTCCDVIADVSPPTSMETSAQAHDGISATRARNVALHGAQSPQDS